MDLSIVTLHFGHQLRTLLKDSLNALESNSEFKSAKQANIEPGMDEKAIPLPNPKRRSHASLSYILMRWRVALRAAPFVLVLIALRYFVW